MSEDVYQFHGTKAKSCNRDPETQSQKYLFVSRATKREKQEYEAFHCVSCIVHLHARMEKHVHRNV